MRGKLQRGGPGRGSQAGGGQPGVTGGCEEAVLPRAFPAGPGRCPAPAPSETTLTPGHGAREGAARRTPGTTLSVGRGRAARTPPHTAPEKVRRPFPGPVRPQSGEREGLLGTGAARGAPRGTLSHSRGPPAPRPTHRSGAGADGLGARAAPLPAWSGSCAARRHLPAPPTPPPRRPGCRPAPGAAAGAAGGAAPPRCPRWRTRPRRRCPTRGTAAAPGCPAAAGPGPPRAGGSTPAAPSSRAYLGGCPPRAPAPPGPRPGAARAGPLAAGCWGRRARAGRLSGRRPPAGCPGSPLRREEEGGVGRALGSGSPRLRRGHAIHVHRDRDHSHETPPASATPGGQWTRAGPRAPRSRHADGPDRFGAGGGGRVRPSGSAQSGWRRLGTEAAAGHLGSQQHRDRARPPCPSPPAGIRRPAASGAPRGRDVRRAERAAHKRPWPCSAQHSTACGGHSGSRGGLTPSVPSGPAACAPRSVRAGQTSGLGSCGAVGRARGRGGRGAAGPAAGLTGALSRQPPLQLLHLADQQGDVLQRVAVLQQQLVHAGLRLQPRRRLGRQLLLQQVHLRGAGRRGEAPVSRATCGRGGFPGPETGCGQRPRAGGRGCTGGGRLLRGLEGPTSGGPCF